MGDKYIKLHRKKNPKLTKEQIEQRRLERKKIKEMRKNGTKTKTSKRAFDES